MLEKQSELKQPSDPAEVSLGPAQCDVSADVVGILKVYTDSMRYLLDGVGLGAVQGVRRVAEFVVKRREENEESGK